MLRACTSDTPGACLYHLLIQDAVHTMVAVIGVGLCFAIMSGVQAYILNNPALRNPRQVWYEEHKARLSGLGEHTMGRLAALKDKPGPTELRATLLISLM
jgi:hypothetical protein